MNREKWLAIESPLVLAVKLAEESGEVSKALLDAIEKVPEDGEHHKHDTNVRQLVNEVLVELGHVEFIGNCLRTLIEQIGNDEDWQELLNGA